MTATTVENADPAPATLPPQSTVNKSDLIERAIETEDDRKCTFQFLTIDSAEKWKEASEFRTVFEMPILGSDRTMQFNVRGLSLADCEVIETQHRISDWKGEGNPPPAFEESRQQVIFEKMVHVFEEACEIKFPGETWGEKANAVRKLNPGEIEALYQFIFNKASNGADGPLLGQYDLLSSFRKNKSKATAVFTDFSQWEAATRTGYFFRMQRPLENFIIEFPLKNISSADRAMIESETRTPDAPKMPRRGPDKKPIPGEMIPDLEDEGWLRACRAVGQKRTAMYLNACLTFQIPGANLQAQYEWLSKRLLGDVTRLRDFIEEDLIGYRSRFDFFTNS